MEREASTPAPHLSASQILQIATQLSTTANGANGPASEGGADLQRSASVGAQSTGSGANREPLDPKWIEIMMGKDDAVRMRDCGKILRDPAKSTDEKLAAFDELEMLVESIDNANNLAVLNLWKPMIEILKTDENPKMRKYAAWVMGTGVQNNPEGQKKLMEEGGFNPILDALKNEKDLEVRSKLLYCVSGLLKKNAKAREQFVKEGGIGTVAQILKESSTPEELALRRKAAFLVKNMVIEDENLLAKFQEEGILETLESIVLTSDDQELVEKLLQFAIVALRRDPNIISAEKKANLLSNLPQIKERVTGEPNGQFTLDPEDVEDLESLLKS